MVGGEIGINDYSEKTAPPPVEPDLGEHIIQPRHEPPSHIIAPAIHLMKEQVVDAFRAAHDSLPADRPLDEVSTLCDEARSILRRNSSPQMSALPAPIS